jgi:hypothetical protein
MQQFQHPQNTHRSQPSLQLPSVPPPGGQISPPENFRHRGGALRQLAGWWLGIASLTGHIAENTLAQRELLRRSRLVAWLIVGLFMVVLVLIPLAITDQRAQMTLLLFTAGLLVAVWLNRTGRVTGAGILLVALVSGALLEANLASPIGLTLGELPNFDAYVVSVVLAATVLPRWTTFVVALINTILIGGNYLLQPHNANLQHDALLYPSVQAQTVSLLARPIALQFILAVVAFLWARSMDRALHRADRAEELTQLQQRELARNQALEDGVRMLLTIHVALANGNFAVRVPEMSDPMLWRVGMSLNMLIRRLQAFAQQPLTPDQAAYVAYNEQMVVKMTQEAEQLVAALQRLLAGQAPSWPEPGGTPLDAITMLMQELVRTYGLYGLPRGQERRDTPRDNTNWLR